MQAAEIVIYIVDQTATKVWLDKAIIIETYGHAAAMHAMDFDDAVRGGMTALPNVAAGAAGGLPVSAAGGLDLDTLLGTLTSLAAETRDANVLDQFRRTLAIIESQRGAHSHQPIGVIVFVDPVNGATHASGARGGITDPYLTIQDCHDNAVTDSNHDVILLLAGAAAGVTTHTVAATTTISKRYCLIRGPGRDFVVTRTGNGDTFAITGDGVEISGVQIGTAATGSGNGITITDVDFHRIHHCWFLDTQGDGISILRGENTRIHDNHFLGTGVAGSGQGVHISGTSGAASNNAIFDNEFADTAGTAILIDNGTILNTQIYGNTIHGATGWGIDIQAASTDAMVYQNVLGGNSSGNINDSGTTSVVKNNTDWLYSTTEGRALDVTATGAAGIDWANVENPTTVLNLSQTDIQLVDTATVNTDFATWSAGITLLAEWLGILGGKQAGDATAQAEMRATGAGSGTIDPTTDSGEAVRDRGDSAWTTATGFSTHAATDIVSAGAITTLSGAVVNVDLVDVLATYTGNTLQTGDSFARIGVAGASLSDLGGMSTAMKGEVNTEVVDVLRTDTATELAATPAASPGLHTMVQFVYMSARNKLTSTASASTINNSAGSAIGTSVDSDDTTTFTRGKFS